MLNRFINKLSRKKNEVSKLQELNMLPRYTPGEYSCDALTVDFPDAASFVSIYVELFDHEIYKFSSNRPEPFVIDCGANIGLSVIYFLKLYPNARILAFEPDIEIYSFLKKNVDANCSTDRIELINKGLWNENGILKFKNEGADAGRISFNHDSLSFNKEIEIVTVKLSEYINRPVDFLKIDIEGAEIKVINEIESKLYLVDKIFIEYHSFINSRQDLDAILTILTRNNFRYYLDTPTKLKSHPLIDENSFLAFDMLVNIFATKISMS